MRKPTRRIKNTEDDSKDRVLPVTRNQTSLLRYFDECNGENSGSKFQDYQDKLAEKKDLGELSKQFCFLRDTSFIVTRSRSSVINMNKRLHEDSQRESSAGTSTGGQAEAAGQSDQPVDIPEFKSATSPERCPEFQHVKDTSQAGDTSRQDTLQAGDTVRQDTLHAGARMEPRIPKKIFREPKKSAKFARLEKGSPSVKKQGSNPFVPTLPAKRGRLREALKCVLYDYGHCLSDLVMSPLRGLASWWGVQDDFNVVLFSIGYKFYKTLRDAAVFAYEA